MPTSTDFIVPAFKAELLATAKTDAEHLHERLAADPAAQAAYDENPIGFLLGAAAYSFERNWPDAWGPAALFDYYHEALAAAFDPEIPSCGCELHHESLHPAPCPCQCHEPPRVYCPFCPALERPDGSCPDPRHEENKRLTYVCTRCNGDILDLSESVYDGTLPHRYKHYPSCPTTEVSG